MKILIKILPWLLGIVSKIIPKKKPKIESKSKGEIIMNYEVIYEVLKKIWCMALKDEVHKLTLKTDSKVDDVVAGVLDKIFSCKQEG